MRRKSREIAFHLLFAAEYHDRNEMYEVGVELDRYLAEHGAVDRECRAFAEHLVGGVLRQREELDRLIEAAGSHWRLARMERVARALLRLGAFELTQPDEKGERMAVEIVIDEAVELAKIYGGDESAAFINGILDAIARQKEPA